MNKYYPLPKSITYNSVDKWLFLFHRMYFLDKGINDVIINLKDKVIMYNVLLCDLKRIINKYDGECCLFFNSSSSKNSSVKKSKYVYKIKMINNDGEGYALRLYLNDASGIRSGTCGVYVENLRDIMYNLCVFKVKKMIKNE